jgi:hypothetical protein
MVAAPGLAAACPLAAKLLPIAINPGLAQTRCSVQAAGSFLAKTGLKERIFVTVVNMSGQSRQAAFGPLKINLPVAQRVVLFLNLGETLRIVSDSNSKIEERFVVSRKDATRTRHLLSATGLRSLLCCGVRLYCASDTHPPEVSVT